MIPRVCACLLAAALLPAAQAHAQAIDAPQLDAPQVQPGDTWTYQNTTESNNGTQQTRMVTTVRSVGAETITATRTPVGSVMPPVGQVSGADWSRLRSIGGHDTVVNRPFSFPLTVGKAWQVDYTADQPNSLYASVHTRTEYKAVGWEDVTVPAGTFHAFKIEAAGRWNAVLAPSRNSEGRHSGDQSPGTLGGRTAKAFWYVAAVKRWVKSVEEYYDANDTRTQRLEDALVSYQVAE